ncbi:MAG: Hsp70 family protein [Syntrophomonas sp.]
MARTTIDFGIDLGTTNSCIAVLNGTHTEVIENTLNNQKLTPSAVWVDSKGHLHVGQKAKERIEDDPENACCEFKLKMGTSHSWTSAHGREMKAEDLSAEVLKSLRADVEHKTGEKVQAAVITVPAEFDLPENQATEKAAQKAGFNYVQLLQEPVAAALAYGFQSASDRVFWLVYDMGGGTFDAAIVNMRDGIIRVVNHGGDKFLGGKLIDHDIIHRLLVPEIKRQYPALDDFTPDNPRYRGAFGKLKKAAEEAKILLSRDTLAQILIDPLCQDDSGRLVRFEYELQNSEVEKLARPYIARSIEICRRVLAEKRLEAANIEKLLLVGGPTLTPLLRRMLNDELGITLEYGIDPLTVVGRGASVYAATQRLEQPLPEAVVPAGRFYIECQYEPVGNDAQPLVGGNIIAPEPVDTSGYTIEFVEPKSEWRSGKTRIEKGVFKTRLKAEKDRQNEFLIDFRDNFGNRLDYEPERIHYTIGITISDPILTHSVGVALANNETQIFLSKGTALPKRIRQVHFSTVEVKKGDPSSLLRIPVVEGENTRRANRNRLIGAVEINGSQVRRDIPAGSEVEITIHIDKSRQVTAEAYIPVLDQVLEKVMSLEKQSPGLEQLETDFGREKERLQSLMARMDGDEKKSDVVLTKIRCEQAAHNVEKALTAARDGDINATDEGLLRLQELQTVIDEIEDIDEWPALVRQAEEENQQTGEIVQEYGSISDKKQYQALNLELRTAIEKRDPVRLQRKLEEVGKLQVKIRSTRVDFWIELLDYLELRKDQIENQPRAARLFNEGRRAINAGNEAGLRNCAIQLLELLPQHERDQALHYNGTTMVKK